MKKIIKISLIGSTGLVGSMVAQALDRIENVELITLSRKENRALSKATQIIDSNMEFSKYPNFSQTDVFINCLGTTIKDAGSKKSFVEIDHDIPLRALASFTGSKIINLSALGAHVNSRVFYSKVKGELELKLNHSQKQVVHIRPSLLLGARSNLRAGEYVAQKLMPSINFLLPKKTRAVKAQDVAAVIVSTALGERLENCPIETEFNNF